MKTRAELLAGTKFPTILNGTGSRNGGKTVPEGQPKKCLYESTVWTRKKSAPALLLISSYNSVYVFWWWTVGGAVVHGFTKTSHSVPEFVFGRQQMSLALLARLSQSLPIPRLKFSIKEYFAMI